MKLFSRLLALVIVLTISFSAMSQLRIPGTHVTFEFPNNDWKYLQTLTPSKNVVIYVYSYDGRTVVDGKGDTVVPFMRVYVRRNYSDTPYDLAYERYTQQPFQSLSESMDGLPSDGIAYIGAYTSASDGKDYQFRMMYFKDRNNALEIRVETTRDTFDQMEDEFVRIMNSVKIEK